MQCFDGNAFGRCDSHDRVNVSLMHSLFLSLPFLSMCVFFNGYHFTQTLPLFGVLYFDALYCVVYVLSDRECACSRSQGYCCKNILTCTFTQAVSSSHSIALHCIASYYTIILRCLHNPFLSLCSLSTHTLSLSLYLLSHTLSLWLSLDCYFMIAAFLFLLFHFETSSRRFLFISL